MIRRLACTATCVAILISPVPAMASQPRDAPPARPESPRLVMGFSLVHVTMPDEASARGAVLAPDGARLRELLARAEPRMADAVPGETVTVSAHEAYLASLDAHEASATKGYTEYWDGKSPSPAWAAEGTPHRQVLALTGKRVGDAVEVTYATDDTTAICADAVSPTPSRCQGRVSVTSEGTLRLRPGEAGLVAFRDTGSEGGLGLHVVRLTWPGDR